MIVRALTAFNDWTFGKGTENYLSGQAAVAQDIKTRLQSFFGDCFFDSTAGIDWFNLLGSKNPLALNLAVSAQILNTEFVNGLTQLSLTLNSARNLNITYTATTTFGTITTALTLTTIDRLLTQSGSAITDQSGNPIII